MPGRKARIRGRIPNRAAEAPKSPARGQARPDRTPKDAADETRDRGPKKARVRIRRDAAGGTNGRKIHAPGPISAEETRAARPPGPIPAPPSRLVDAPEAEASQAAPRRRSASSLRKIQHFTYGRCPCGHAYASELDFSCSSHPTILGQPEPVIFHPVTTFSFRSTFKLT